jgi:Spy/CpxP family protein refolding chaperone
MTSQAQSRTPFLVAAAAALMLAGTATACAAKVEQKAPEEAKTEQLGRAEGKARHFRGPVARVIETVKLHGNLDADQQATVDTIQSELEEDREGRRELHEKLKTSAIGLIRSGSAQDPEFDRSVKEAVAAIEERIQKGTDALEELHAILRPEQRKSVAAAMRVKIAERYGQAKNDKRHEGTFKKFASHLVLSQLQVEQLKTIKQELLSDKEQLRPSREEVLSLVDAFEGEDFSTALGEFHAKKSKILQAHVRKAGQRTDSVLAVFTPQQRELIADLILEGPAKVLGTPRQE